MIPAWLRTLRTRPADSPERRRPARRRRPFARPRVEPLEDRLSPAAHTWTGAVDQNWSNNGNWLGSAPTVAEGNVVLTFPPAAANIATIDDIPGLDDVLAINIAGNGYSFTGGNTITANTGSGLVIETGAVVTSPNTMIDLPIILGAAQSLTVNVGNALASLTLVQGFTGGDNLTKNGLGKFTVNSGANYTGSTTVNGGTLAIGVANAVPVTSDLIVNSSNSFDLNGFDQTVASLSGIGTVTNSSGTPSTLTINIDAAAAAAQFDGVLAGNLSLTKTGSGLQTLAGANPNTYTGSTSVTDGVLVLDKAVGTTAVPGVLTIGDGVGFDELRLDGPNQIADGATPTVTSSGFFNLNGNNETVAALNVNGGSGVDTGTGTLSVTGTVTRLFDTAGLSALIQGNLASGNGTFTVNDDAGAGVDLTIAATITGAAGLTKNGLGALQLGAANQYAGPTVINFGTLFNGAVNAIPVGSPVNVVTGTTYDLFGFDQEVPSLVGGGTVTNTSATAATLTANVAAAANFPGLLRGNLALTKAGAGALTLSGTAANDYTGTTTVNGGTMLLNKTAGTNAVPGALVIGDGTGTDTVRLSAANQIADAANVTVNSSGLLDLNNL